MFGKECIFARRFDTGATVRLTLVGNVLASIEPAESAPEHTWFAPALFDPQINGYAGIDFQRDDFSIDDLLKAVRGLRQAACGQFFFTLTTEDWAILLTRLARARSLRNESKELASAIAGWHIEGPFLSAAPGFHGAHDPSMMLDPTPDHIRELRAAAGDDRLLITIAPERPGAIKAIALAVSLNICVSLGHTDAPADILAEAVQAGATGFTHIGNGCTQALDRHDNILVRVLDTPGLFPSIIPDAIHVSPAMFRLLNTALPMRHCFTTDAMSAAGAPAGRYRIGKIETEVGTDRIVRMPGKTNFAGSALRPIDGVFTAARMLNCSWRETWFRSSLAARRYAGLSNQPDGLPFCVLHIEGNTFKGGSIFADGQRIEIQSA